MNYVLIGLIFYSHLAGTQFNSSVNQVKISSHSVYENCEKAGKSYVREMKLAALSQPGKISVDFICVNASNGN